MADPKANQQGQVTTFGWPSAADVAAQMQAKHAAYRAQQKKLEEATARAEAERARVGEAKAARTRDATQASLFWHDIKQ